MKQQTQNHSPTIANEPSKEYCNVMGDKWHSNHINDDPAAGAAAGGGIGWYWWVYNEKEKRNTK
jgi:hypothetical protein